MGIEQSTPDGYIVQRNRHTETLRCIRKGYPVGLLEQAAALDWAISHLAGLPEHWVHAEAPDGDRADQRGGELRSCFEIKTD